MNWLYELEEYLGMNYQYASLGFGNQRKEEENEGM